MGIISWIILGLIAGWLVGLFVNKPSSGLLQNLVLGVVGAVVGGILASAIFGTGLTGVNIWSIIVSVIGAIVVVWVYNTVVSRS